MHITEEQMNTYVNTGHARKWNQPLNGTLPIAAKIGDTWYAILDNTDTYQPAPPQLAKLLTHTQNQLTTANTTLNQSATSPPTTQP